jgi:hypothetical protein
MDTLTMLSRLVREHGVILCLALAAVSLVVIRACVQSITLDEAESFLLYARKPWPSHWWPSADNHVLNSLLMRFVTVVFGVSTLTVRLPAVLGAVIYISSAVYLCLLLTSWRVLQLLLLTCLVCNPMVLDYLVAARGYSLAVGFLLAAIAIIASAMMADNQEDAAELCRKCAWVSILLALSCAANFSFAIANGTTLTVFFVWAAGRKAPGPRRYLRLAACSILPGAIVGVLLCGSVLLNWPQRELYFGSKHLSEMWRGFAAGSFDELNPYLLNPLVLPLLAAIRGALPYVTVFAALLLLVSVEIRRRRTRDAEADVLGDFVRALVTIAAATLLLHWLAFKIVHFPLPKDRTGLFFVPLWTVAFVGSIAFLFRSGARDLLRYCGVGGVAVLALIALYFIGCLRLGYFKEWRFDADTKQLYWTMEGLRRHCGITRFWTDWRYQLPLNFYREAYSNDSLREFDISHDGVLPTDRDAYAVFLPSSLDFIKQQKLQLVYQNDESHAAVAIRGCPAAARSN